MLHVGVTSLLNNCRHPCSADLA